MRNLLQFYFLPSLISSLISFFFKIHKENIPLRPIVSLPGSPTYELSKYLAMILHPLVKTSPHTINNANDFLTNIKDLKLEPDEIMISFDVVSLFTSIPLDTAKRITNELLTNNDSWHSRTNLDKDDILELLNLCLSSEFSFQNSYLPSNLRNTYGISSFKFPC